MNSSEENAEEDSASHTPSEQRLRQEAESLRKTVSELALQLRPFPSFFGMNTLRAIELELPSGCESRSSPELGCIVVLEDGDISELGLKLISGSDNSVGFDQIEEFTELDLPPKQYISYASVAVRLLQDEIKRRAAG